MSSADESNTTDAAVAEESRLNLDVKIENAGPCKKHIEVKISKEDVAVTVEETVGELATSVEVPGFRTGHVPAELVKKRFKEELSGQIKQRLLMLSLEQISEENDLDPINEPDIDLESLELEEDSDFEYEFDIEVRPDFELPNYAGLKVEKTSEEISDEEIDEFIDRYTAQYAESEPKEEGIEAGDTILCSIDFQKEGESVNQINDISLNVREILRLQDAELEGFDKLLAGAKAGDTKEAEITVSEEAEQVELRGEKLKALFSVKEVLSVKKPEINNEFMERIGFDSVEAFREQIESSLQRQQTYETRQATRRQVLDQITESADWDLPEELVMRQVDNALRREILEMQQAGFTREDIQSRENELRQNAVTSTRQALKEHFVLDKIATEEEIEVSPTEIDIEIQMMAMQSGENPRRVRSRMVKNGMIENLEAQIRERKAIDAILAKAEFVEVTKKIEKSENNIMPLARSVAGIQTAEVSNEEEEAAEE